ncbi:MAG TPA: hypothetical protein VHE34_20715 [Puia sp.]|uniref:hypothetical protein n=1 Tax=Puia sp. TaxID=2045100 RepID=UPI002BBE7C01|nr:hypothetical protein [Puia sp.]HVU97664.1 hypothetical protein [Puia sp.]
MYRTAIRPDITSVLGELAGTIQEQSVPVEQYLRQLRAHQMVNPFRHPGAIRIADAIPEEFLGNKGIRRVIVDEVGVAAEDASGILGRCSLVELADWTELVDNGAWDKLYSTWIKPLGKRDFQFIFHLGDVAYKPVFGIDEVLDIIGDYSSRGRVTLMLDGHEADTLWCRLNGRNPGAGDSGATARVSSEWASFAAARGLTARDSGARDVVVRDCTPQDRWLSLFNTMSIDFLIVLQAGHAVQFSREGQFNLNGPPPVGIGGVINGRIRFSAGYQLGLLLRLDPQHCCVLGMAVAGAYGKLASGSGAELLVEYLRNWIPIN